MRYVYAFLCLIIMSIALVSCDSDSCETIDCGPYKTCVNGICVCEQGLEGDQCQIYSYEKFVGNYQVSESCAASTFPQGTQYVSDIIQDSRAIDRIYITQFANFGLTVEAVINGIYVTIPNQNQGSYNVEGSGEYNTATGRITIQYNLTSGSNSASCTAVFSPR